MNAVAIRDRSAALALLVTRMLASYQRQKSLRSLLDYDDLIARTRSLLERVEAAWVLYKLDAGIDHILLDEAQDTGEAQWAILRKLAEEFTSGGDLRAKPRTIFVVGDEKQSIYGFQGAAPSAFGEERRALGNRIRAAERDFEAISLNTSFRSAPDIMQAVDAVFALPDHARGLVFDGATRPEIHDTVRRNAPGTVDIWPLAANDTGEPPDAWTTPVDAPERRSGTVKLAERIARTLQRWHRDHRDDLGHPFAAGDVMILLRQRGALFEAIVKALKDEGVPVAGRDRLTLAEHPAVEDLVVLGRALLLPDDDLTLATALKTPLIDLDDDDLLHLAPNRKGSLRAALQEAAATESRYAAAEAKLVHWAREAGRCGPFRFFADLLGPGGGRNLALARLGAEAGDALDAFLNAALDHERRYGPSLAGFLQHVAGSAADVKRDLSASAGEVRVMTVHGSKGLEAKIVILADLGVEPGARRLPKILAVPAPSGDLVPLWPPASAEDVQATAAAKAAVVAQMVEEHHRLLYVAMTRAEDRLIVCGAQPKGEAPPGSWYAMIEQGLMQSDAGLKQLGEGDDAVLRFMISTPLSSEAEDSRPEAEAASVAVPQWLREKVVREAEPLPPLKPSSALTAADGEERPGDGPFLAEAAAAGRLAHLLLQVLPGVPEERRIATAEALAEARGGALRPERRATIVADALQLLAAPALAGLFAPDALAEVPVAGSIRLPDGDARAVSGRIDRLAVTADSVVVADFKTTARPSQTADAIPVTTIAQLAAYAALMREIYPGRQVRALAIYTASLTCFELDAGRLDAALATVANGEGVGSAEERSHHEIRAAFPVLAPAPADRSRRRGGADPAAAKRLALGDAPARRLGCRRCPLSRPAGDDDVHRDGRRDSGAGGAAGRGRGRHPCDFLPRREREPCRHRRPAHRHRRAADGSARHPSCARWRHDPVFLDAAARLLHAALCRHLLSRWQGRALPGLSRQDRAGLCRFPVFLLHDRLHLADLRHRRDHAPCARHRAGALDPDLHLQHLDPGDGDQCRGEPGLGRLVTRRFHLGLAMHAP